jgi:hypothetical protein
MRVRRKYANPATNKVTKHQRDEHIVVEHAAHAHDRGSKRKGRKIRENGALYDRSACGLVRRKLNNAAMEMMYMRIAPKTDICHDVRGQRVAPEDNQFVAFTPGP